MPCKVKDVPGCRDCPLFEDGNKNFVPDTLREGAEVMVLGQNPGAEEEATGQPFVGPTGAAMDRDFLPQAGLTRNDVSIGNAIRCRYQNSNNLPEVQSILARTAVDHCTRAHLRIPPGTRLLVATGGYALMATTGHGWAKHDKITEWRGWMLPLKTELGGSQTYDSDIYTPRVAGSVGFDPPVLATVHVAAVGYDPKLRLPAKSDWQKVKRYFRGEWPQTPPEIRREVDEDLFDYEAAWDTEFIPESNTLLRFSAATGGGDVYCVENSPRLVETLGRYIQVLNPLPEKVACGLRLQLVNGVWVSASQEARAVLRIFFQNADADLPYLARIFPEGTVIAIEDEMLAHSVLHGGAPHSLDYLSSLHSPLNRHKHLASSNEVVYSAMDAYTQYIVWRVIERELKADPGSEKEYREGVLPLVPIIGEAEEAGILINQEEVSKGVEYLRYEMEDSRRIAEAAAGYKINIGSSQQVGRQLYDVEEIKAPRGRR